MNIDNLYTCSKCGYRRVVRNPGNVSTPTHCDGLVMIASKRILTTVCFLDGNVIELSLLDNVLSDKGRAYEAIIRQINLDVFPANWIVRLADEVCRAYGVQYQSGIFSLVLTEITLEEAVFQLISAALTFYGMSIGTYRGAKGLR